MQNTNNKNTLTLKIDSLKNLIDKKTSISKTEESQLKNSNNIIKGFYSYLENIYSKNEYCDFNDISYLPKNTVLDVVKVGNIIKKYKIYSNSNNFYEKDVYLPLLLPFNDSNGLFFSFNNKNKEEVYTLVQSIAIRIINSLALGLINFKFIDFDFDFQYILNIHENINNKEDIITSDYDIKKLFDEFVMLSKDVILKISPYKNLSDYNKAQKYPEPYHFLFISNFPSGFNNEKLSQLESIIKNGIRTGIYVIATFDESYNENLNKAANFKDSVDLFLSQRTIVTTSNNISTNIEEFQSLNLEPDNITDIDLIKKIRDFKNISKEEEETSSAIDVIKIPIGRLGNDTHYFSLGDKSNVYHSLIGGGTGSGKTNLLHNIITNVVDHYSPDQLRLWLLDYKDGTEFKIYENHPNVEFLSLSSKVDFGIETLKRLQEKISERGELFKKINVANIINYNNKSKDKIPLIFFIIDEFQVLFDTLKMSKEVNIVLADIAQRGRSFGLHLLLSSQAVHMNVENPILYQLGLRIVLKNGSYSKFLTSNNDSHKKLRSKGQAIYNNRGGEEGEDFNKIINIDYLPQDEIINKLNSASKNTSYSPFKKEIYDGY